ncbi:glycoside hydrolase family 28 protein [Polaribacter staleyi]|uniref:glycoside hydrolase family 28 protein n=1 Tax=Polaribacter staleyi TaxID=2022337 RepID=UPI0031B9E892
MKILKSIILLLSISFATNARDFNISDYNAINDGKTLNTKAIQQAIDECTLSGGGTVKIDGGGIYVSGTIYLKDNVSLHIEGGTTLQGSPNYNDYTQGTYKMMYQYSTNMDRCFIYAENSKNISIVGFGTIDGNGHLENFAHGAGRPMLIRMLKCQNIHLNNINLINPASWTSVFLYCDNIEVSGINIYSRANYNGDGLDFDGCTRVRVSNSNFDNSDDCICLQTSRSDKPCKDIVITNNIFRSKWAGIRIGLLSKGDIESVTVSNCTFRDIEDAGLKIQQNEGGEMKNMTFSNLVMENVPRPIFMTFCQQRMSVDTPKGQIEPIKRMHGFYFNNIIVDNSKGDKNSAIFITGLPNHKIEDTSIKNIRFIVSGGGTKKDASKIDSVKEFTSEVMGVHSPEFYSIGTLPASGIFVRHAAGLHLENINLIIINEDERPSIVLDDVTGFYSSFLKNNGRKIDNIEIVNSSKKE